MNDVLKAVAQPIPRKFIKKKKEDDGRVVDYVPWQGVVDLLNERTGGDWSTEILKTNIDETWATVTLALTIAGQTRVSIAQEHLVGKRQFKFPGLEVAERTALKRAAALFGLHSDADGNLTWLGSETVNEDTGEITSAAPQSMVQAMSKVENIPTPALQRTLKDLVAEAETVDAMNDILAQMLEKGLEPTKSEAFMNRCDALEMFYDPETQVVQADLPFADVEDEVPA